MPYVRNAMVASAAVLAVAIAGAASGAAAEPSPSAPAWVPADDDAAITAVESLDARTRDLSIESPAVGTARVRLLLPPAFETRADETFPVLYLLHGGGGGYIDWTKNTDVEAYTAGIDVLVAMPDASTANMSAAVPEGGPDGEGGPPNWERFHLIELPQLLERNWRAGEERAVAGLSLGGYAAVMYAGRSPELFEAVASYSGALDLTVTPGVNDDAQELVEQATALAEATGWDQVNPVNLVPSLEGTAIYISYGNGEPGPLDPADAGHDPLEAWISIGNENFVTVLTAEEIPAEVNAYGPGTHSWAYWDRELEASLPLLLESMGVGGDAPD